MNKTTYRTIGTGSVVLAMLLSIGCSDDPPDGKKLYNDFCATSCHGINNAGTENVPPVQTASFRAIRDAIDLVSEMFTLDQANLSRGEITAIADYIRTIPPP